MTKIVTTQTDAHWTCPNALPRNYQRPCPSTIAMSSYSLRVYYLRNRTRANESQIKATCTLYKTTGLEKHESPFKVSSRSKPWCLCEASPSWKTALTSIHPKNCPKIDA